MAGDYAVAMDQEGAHLEKKKDHWKTALIVLLIVAVIIGGAVGLALHFQKPPKIVLSNTAVSPLTFFDKSSAMDVTWAHAVNSQAALQSTLDSEVDMLEADVIQTDEPIMAHPPATTSDISLAQWLDKVLEHKTKKGIKLDFKQIAAVEPSLKLLRERRAQLNQPVWLNADILPGPNAGRTPVNATSFLKMVDDIYPNATLSLGWVIGDGPEKMYTEAMVKEMYDLVKFRKQAVTLAVHAGLAVVSWQHLRWFLQQDTERFTLTLWLSNGSWGTVTPNNLMKIQNEYNATFLYYDLPPGMQMNQFRHLTVTGGSPLNHFQADWNPLNIMWGRGVNNMEALDKAVSGSSMMLCGDVNFRDGAPSMGSSGNLTLNQWLNRVVSGSMKGIKLTFHENSAVEPSLKMIQDMPTQNVSFRQPVWLEAEIMTTDNEILPSILPSMLSSLVPQYANDTTLVLSWASANPSTETIDEVMAAEMLAYVRDNFAQPVIFKIHASMVARSWQHIKQLIETPDLFRGLLLWAEASDLVDPDDMVSIFEQAGPSQVFFDLPEPVRKSVISRMQ